MRTAARLNPASAVIYLNPGWNDLHLGTYLETERHPKTALALGLDRSGVVRMVLDRVQLGRDSTEAPLRQMRRAVEASPRPWTLAYLGWTVHAGRRLDSTKAVLSRLQRDFEAPFHEAALYVALGTPDPDPPPVPTEKPQGKLRGPL